MIRGLMSDEEWACLEPFVIERTGVAWRALHEHFGKWASVYHRFRRWTRSAPKVLLADKGYDADFIREDMEKRGGTTMIPTKRSNRRLQSTIDSY